MYGLRRELIEIAEGRHLTGWLTLVTRALPTSWASLADYRRQHAHGYPQTERQGWPGCCNHADQQCPTRMPPRCSAQAWAIHPFPHLVFCIQWWMLKATPCTCISTPQGPTAAAGSPVAARVSWATGSRIVPQLHFYTTTSCSRSCLLGRHLPIPPTQRRCLPPPLTSNRRVQVLTPGLSCTAV